MRSLHPRQRQQWACLQTWEAVSLQHLSPGTRLTATHVGWESVHTFTLTFIPTSAAVVGMRLLGSLGLLAVYGQDLTGETAGVTFSMCSTAMGPCPHPDWGLGKPWQCQQGNAHKQSVKSVSRQDWVPPPQAYVKVYAVLTTACSQAGVPWA